MASEANVNASELACLPVEVLAERWPELSLKDQLAVYRVDSEKAERAYAVAKNKEKVTSSPTKAGLAQKAREFVVDLSELVLAAAPLLPEFDPDSHLDGPIEAALSWLLQVKAQLQPEAGALVEQSFPIVLPFTDDPTHEPSSDDEYSDEYTLFLALPMSFGLSSIVFAAVCVHGSLDVGSIVAIKAGHCREDPRLTVTASRVRTSRTMLRVEAVLASHLAPTGACPVMASGHGVLLDATRLTFSADDRHMLVLPLGVQLNWWWEQVQPQLGQEERQSVLRWVASSVCRSMAMFHALGVVHLDVKPSNILVVPDDPARIRGRIQVDADAEVDAAPHGWSVALIDFGGASVPPSIWEEASPLPPQHRFGGPRRKIEGGAARPVDDLESLVLSLMSLAEPGSERRWEVSADAEASSWKEVPGCNVLWNLDELAECEWYEEIRDAALSGRGDGGLPLYPEVRQVIVRPGDAGAHSFVWWMTVPIALAALVAAAFALYEQIVAKR